MSTRRTIIGVVLFMTCAAAWAQTPAGSAFTYQGQLNLNGSPVNGQTDMLFDLFDAETEGAQLAGYGAEMVPVTDGLFTVALDFGPYVFNGDARWLEIRVRYPANGGEYVTLSPRQELTPTPYALHALQALGPWVQSGTSLHYDGGNVGIENSDPVAPLSFASELGKKISLWGSDPDHQYGLGIGPGLLQVYADSSSDNIAFGYGGSEGFTEYMRINGGGNVGIGAWPTEKLTVAGMVHSTTGGFKFPDGSVQTTALSSTLNSNGALSLVGVAQTQGAAWSVGVQGNYAYVANGDLPTLQVFDVADPTHPTLVGGAATGSGQMSLAVAGGHAYVVNYDAGNLQVFDLSSPVEPVLVGSAATGANPTSIAVAGSYACVVNEGSNSLQVFDVANPASPTLVGSATTGDYPECVAVAGAHAYVGCWGVLQIFDISNPASPALVGSAEPCFSFSVAVSGDYAWVADDEFILRVFDVSSPASPTQVGSAELPYRGRSVAVAGGHAYVLTNRDLEVFNADPDSLTLLDSAPIPWELSPFWGPSSLAVSGAYVFVGTDSDLRILTMSSMDSSWPASFPALAVAGTVNAGDVRVTRDLTVDVANANNGEYSSPGALRFGDQSGEFIASKRTNGGSQFGLDFYTQNWKRMSITYDGKVRIGTDGPAGGPTDKLSVAGGAVIGAAYAGNYAPPPDGLLVQGKVCIGTQSPTEQALTIQGGLNLDVGNANPGSIFNEALRFGYSGGPSGEGIASRRTAGGNQWGLDFYTHYVNRMSITNAGDIGIGTGTTTPIARLDVLGANDGIAIDGVSHGTDGLGVLGDCDDGIGVYGYSNTGTGVYALSVDGCALQGESTGGSGVEGYSTNNAGVYGWSQNNVGVWGESQSGFGGYFTGDGYFSGNLGIGTSPSEKLDVNGTARLQGIAPGSGTTVVADGSGKLWKQSSSLRYKDHVTDLPPAGDAVLGLRPVTFEWKSTGVEDVGLIAEEVAAVLPDLVICDTAGQPDAVKYDRVALYLLDVVKAQRTQLSAQETQLATQQRELSDLRARLEKLEAALSGPVAAQRRGAR